MRLQSSAFASGRVAVASAGRLAGRSGLGARALAAVRRAWGDQVYLHQRLLDCARPWEHDGPLQWQREWGGLRLVGSTLGEQEPLPDQR